MGVDVPAGDYQIEKFCLEPTGIEVREEAGGDFTPTKLMTRLTYTLDEISGKFKIGGGNSVSFQEEDGIDYAATTVQLPGAGPPATRLRRGSSRLTRTLWRPRTSSLPPC